MIIVAMFELDTRITCVTRERSYSPACPCLLLILIFWSHFHQITLGRYRSSLSALVIDWNGLPASIVASEPLMEWTLGNDTLSSHWTDWEHWPGLVFPLSQCPQFWCIWYPICTNELILPVSSYHFTTNCKNRMISVPRNVVKQFNKPFLEARKCFMPRVMCWCPPFINCAYFITE